MARRGLVLLLAVLGVARGLRAEDDPLVATTAVADAFVAARAKGDAAAQAEIARREPPSPWFLAEILLARGQPDDAAAYAAAAKRVGTEGLEAYVASRRKTPVAPALLATLLRADRAQRAGKMREALDALASIEEPKEGVPGALAAYVHAQALRQDPSSVEALPFAQRALDEADRIGWLAMAADASEIVGKALWRRGKLQDAERVMRRRVEIERSLGNAWSEGHALGDLGMPLEVMGRLDEALEAYRGSLAIMERLGDKREMGRARGNVGDVLYRQARYREALVEKLAAIELERAVGDELSAAVHATGVATLRITALGEWDQGVREFEAALAELDRLGATKHAASGRHNLALAHIAHGDRDRALELLERVLPVLERLQDADGMAGVLLQMGVVHRDGGDFRRAAPLLERAVAMRRDQDNPAGLAYALIELGRLRAESKDNAGALAALDGAAQILRDTKELRVRAAVAQERADVLARARRFAEARVAIDDLLGVLARWDDPVARARALGHVAELQGAVGDHDAAIDTARSAGEALSRAGSGADAADKARAVDRLARVLLEAGRLTEASETAKRAAEEFARLGDTTARASALGVAAYAQLDLGDFAGADATLEGAERAAEGGPPAVLARLLDARAHVASVSGDLGRAITWLERALALARDAQSPDRVAEILMHLGLVYADVGDLPRATAYFDDALALARERGDRHGVGRTLQNRGAVRMDLGDAAGAEADLREALEIFESTGWPEAQADVLVGLAEVLARAKKHDEARAMLEEALRRDAGPADGPRAAVTRGNLAMLLAERGEHAKAVEMLTAAAKAARARPFQLVKMQVALARSLHALGRREEALKAALEAVATSQLLARGLAEDEAALARERHGRVAEELLSLVVGSGDAKAAWDLIEPTRSVALLEALRGRALLESAALPPELLRAEAEAHAREAAARRRLDARLSEGARKDIVAAQKEYDAARVATLEVVRRIQREAKAAGDLVFPVAADLEAVKARLAPEEALLEYALLEESSAVLVVTRTDARLVVLPARSEIEAAVERAFPEGLPSQDAAPLAALRRLLLERLALPATVKRILVSPDGVLAYVPFAALDPSRDVVAVASGSTLLLLAQEAGPPGEGVLGVGNPDYAREGRPASETSLLRSGLDLAPLPRTEAEVRAVGTRVLLGRDATEAKLRVALEGPQRWRAVHLACHGLLDAEHPLLCALAVTPSGADDGLLSADDVCRLRVRADLVVLSACETGRGRVYRSEGIVGLTRAFMFAGAPRVLVSLWKVDDEATKALMIAFYERLGAGVPTPRALREAQETVRAQPRWKEPRFWAAWVLWGLPS